MILSASRKYGGFLMMRKPRFTKRVLHFVAVMIMAFFIFIGSLQFSHHHYADLKSDHHAIAKRRLPYPFKSALTICSDIDGTESLSEFLMIQEYLNTKNTTAIGVGLGLEIGNSFFPVKTGESPLALDLNNPAEKEVILDLIKLGYIDTIHSFVGAERKEIQKITDFLSRNDCQIDVWVNHANDPTDVGYFNYALGDNQNSNYYHTDFSVKTLGYKFVWTGEVSSLVGQGIPLNLSSFFAPLNRQHWAKSLVNNVFKEIYKYTASFLGKKYLNRKNNELTYPLRLDDGHPVFGFIRNNVSYQGAGEKGATSEALAEVLRDDILEKLNENGGMMIIYNHFGVNKGYPYFSENTQKALKRLEGEYTRGNIYVTTTKKLLEYYVNNKYLNWHSTKEQNNILIHINFISDPVRGTFVPTRDDLRGITFYTADPAHTHLFIQDQEIKDIVRNENDSRNRKSIMVALKPLPSLDDKMKEYKNKGYFGSHH
jgi:hypothetical protein